MDEIGLKWDKSGNYSDQISVHFEPKYIETGFVPFGAYLTHIMAKPDTPGNIYP